MTGLTGFPKSLLLGILTIVIVAQMPLTGYSEELRTRPDQVRIPELELIKEEETVSIPRVTSNPSRKHRRMSMSSQMRISATQERRIYRPCYAGSRGWKSCR